MTAQEIIAIIQLAETLAPEAVKLVMALMQDLSGKTSEEVLAEADTILARVKAKAREEQGK